MSEPSLSEHVRRLMVRAKEQHRRNMQKVKDDAAIWRLNQVVEKHLPPERVKVLKGGL